MINNLDHVSRIFCLILSCNFLLQSGQPVDERFWKIYCVDMDPPQWPCITKRKKGKVTSFNIGSSCSYETGINGS